MPRGAVCHHCGRPIGSRASLAVGGRMLRPLHATCYNGYAAGQPWYLKPGWPLNRWRSLVWFNALLAGMALALHLTIAPLPPERRGGLAILWLIINAWLLLARLISYRTMERHLPARDEAAGGQR